MFRKYLAPVLVFALAAGWPALQAQQAPTEKIDTAMNARIRAEGMNNSQIMKTMHVLTDVYGPRLTGSPNLENAGKWAIGQMRTWGMKNGHQEAFEFKTATVTPSGGWLNEMATGRIVAPVQDNLVFEVLSWTPSTKGVVRASAVQLITPANPTAETLKTYLDSMARRVKGAVVLVGAHTWVPFQETPPAKRMTDEAARVRFGGAPADPNAGRGGRPGGAGPAQPVPGALTASQVATAVNDFLLANGAGVRVNDAAREHGQIRAFNFAGYDPTKTVPTVVLRNEDYGRIARLLADGPVQLEFAIKNKDFPAGKTIYNTIAEIPGTDKADEVVMLGGHLDSWHSATGATDNAIGSAVMMEAARILQALGVKPRRTIRVALWAAEEQGLLGSKAYVAQHFGTAEAPKPEFAKFDGYFNVDSGTGRLRGGSIFGPPEAAQIVSQFFKPFEDLGVMGAIPSTSRTPGGTDSTSFNAAGLAGIGMGTDPMEYNSHTWHTNLDTLERIVEDDVKKSAIVMASAVYHIAMRDEMLPRFTAATMPVVPGRGRGGGPAQK